MYIDCSDIKGVVNFQVSLRTKEYCFISCFLNFQDQAYCYDGTKLISRLVYMLCLVFSHIQILVLVRPSGSVHFSAIPIINIKVKDNRRCTGEVPIIFHFTSRHLEFVNSKCQQLT